MSDAVSDLMSDLNAATGGRIGGVPCQTCVELERMPADEIAELDRLIRSGALPRARAGRILRQHGYHVTTSSIEGHYRKEHDR